MKTLFDGRQQYSVKLYPASYNLQGTVLRYKIKPHFPLEKTESLWRFYVVWELIPNPWSIMRNTMNEQIRELNYLYSGYYSCCYYDNQQLNSSFICTCMQPFDTYSHLLVWVCYRNKITRLYAHCIQHYKLFLILVFEVWWVGPDDSHMYRVSTKEGTETKWL